MKRLRIDASYFHIIYRNRVVTPIPSNYSVAFNPIYSSFVLLNPSQSLVLAALSDVPVVYDFGGGDVRSGGVGAIVTNYLQNAARQKIEGVYVAADYTLPLDERSVLHFNGSASYLQIEQQIGPLQSVVQRSEERSVGKECVSK